MGWKLVRDNNQAWCEANGVSGAWRTASEAEAVRALGRKLGEEVLEYLEDGDPAELLDLRDALEELLTLTARPGLEEAHARKAALHGKFGKHVMWSPYPGEEVPGD